MRRTLEGVLDVFRRFTEAKRLLHAAMDDCLKRIYVLARKKCITARPVRDRDGLLRRIRWVMRTEGKVRHKGHEYPVHLTLKAPINTTTVYNVLRDYGRVEEWIATWMESKKLNAKHAVLGPLHRNFRAALALKFGRLAGPEDRQYASALLRNSAFLLPLDHDALLGAAVYDRLLRDLERQISDLVLRWKDQMTHLPFEPLIRWRASGPLRLSWAYVERFYDASRALQVRSQEIPAGVSDRWLRQHHPEGGPARRKVVLGYAVRLRTLTRQYSMLLVYVGRLKSRVRLALDSEMNGARPVAGADAI